MYQRIENAMFNLVITIVLLSWGIAMLCTEHWFVTSELVFKVLGK